LALPAPGHAQPATHAVDALVEAEGHQIPAPQLRHVELLVAPRVVENVPDGHMPLRRPPPPQNQPAGHCVVGTDDPGGQKYPAEHPAQAEREMDAVEGL
jgi:hypothetical protein